MSNDDATRPYGDVPEPAPAPEPGTRTEPGTEPTVRLDATQWDASVSPDQHEAPARPSTTTYVTAPSQVQQEAAARRQLSVSHLVTGLVFLGISALWLAQEVGVVEVEDMDLLVPMLLVVVGAAGLLAGMLRAARRG